MLLAEGYTETHYTEEGLLVTLTPNHTDHCYYHGRVRGVPGSWVALSTCAGIRGLIVLSANASYYVEPRRPPEPGRPDEHRLLRAEGLPAPPGACPRQPRPPPRHLRHLRLRPHRATPSGGTKLRFHPIAFFHRGPGHARSSSGSAPNQSLYSGVAPPAQA
ncbi:disintegrin and metalloproteinase domain-containing protein 33-like [Ornithorhynchus anatinus]|uniref:disintegrin and metalloproteinase domain-containing protein 33-like n=1 Tax=Ornithorhynchus anatinus TaxID=9258 RepID=UPI0019D49415|nr:disintegrin and metalloproteinase domain-containing protein 33-like [Ornithorhynchus anatinus]